MTGLPIQIKAPKNNRKITVGYLHQTGKGRVFYKTVNSKVHYMKIVEGYGMQKEVFDKYLRGRKGRIIIRENDTNKWLVASIKTWTEHSSAANYGDGKQIFLSKRFMHGADDN
jgi:hypothetical protein